MYLLDAWGTRKQREVGWTMFHASSGECMLTREQEPRQNCFGQLVEALINAFNADVTACDCHTVCQPVSRLGYLHDGSNQRYTSESSLVAMVG